MTPTRPWRTGVGLGPGTRRSVVRDLLRPRRQGADAPLRPPALLQPASSRPVAHRGRLLAAGGIVLLLLGTLVGRLAQVQVVDPEGSRAVVAATTTRTLVLAPVRGRILDRDGVPLAENTASMDITLDRRQWVRDPEGTVADLRTLAALLGRPSEDVVGRAHLCGEPGAPKPPVCWNGSPQAPIPVATEVDPTKALTFVERPDLHPGFAVANTAVRSYPQPRGANMAQALGYLGPASQTEVDAPGWAFGPFALIGRSGLEQQYDKVLRGVPGQAVVSVDPRGVVTGTLSRREPTPGRDLVTSLDVRVQATAEAALQDAVTQARARGKVADSAAAVVLDVRTGDVIAAASLPSYDPNVWTGGIAATAYASLTDPAAGQPMLSRAIGVALAPASTIKALSVPAAVAAGNPLDGSYACPASLTIGDRTFTNFESQAYGSLNFVDALRVSCDTVFYGIAHRQWSALGGVANRSDASDAFIQTDRAFGLGQLTGIDLPGEAAGTVPGRDFKTKTWAAMKDDLCRRAQTGYPDVAASDPERATYLTQLAQENCVNGFEFRAGDAVNLSIGQGELAVTPLQLTVAYAAIANGGTLLTPRVGGSTVDVVTGVRQKLPLGSSRAAGLDPAVGDVVRTGLRAVVTDGTAAGAFAGLPEDWPVAGKTGTAEVFGKGDTSWFASYAPADSPRYAVTVVVTQGGTGADTAAPAARVIHEALRVNGY